MSSLPLGVYDALVPVPTTRRRLRQRGFNQAQLLAERLGEIWGMPVLPALSRRDEHAAQTKLSAENRRRNLEGCMEADSAVRGLRALVVDDVLTTGSTASEAARALLAAGAARVGLVTAAKTTNDKGGALFAPARELPSFVQILRGK